ncbi:hypothetical protein FV222_01475 [Methylobacterium sp. WL103]|nr:hypothetical protein FV222_01475 [Methylobacterium sp. WL103]
MPPLFAALERMARAEVIVALREPQRRLTVLLHNRSVALAEQAELDRFADEAAQVRAELEADPTWGMF